VKGIFFTKYLKNRNLSKEIKNYLKDLVGDKLMETTIRVNVSLAESQANGKDIFDYQPKSRGADDYMSLVKEVINQ
jgi:chromosome partitioning protein